MSVPQGLEFSSMYFYLALYGSGASWDCSLPFNPCPWLIQWELFPKGRCNKKSGMAVLCPQRTTGVVNPWGCGVYGVVHGGRDHLACLCCMCLSLIMER